MTAKRETVLHFEMTLEELKSSRGGGYTDPDRYKAGHRDYSPEMLCHTGQFRAPGTRNRRAVTCPACLEALRIGEPEVSDYQMVTDPCAAWKMTRPSLASSSHGGRGNSP